MLVHNVPLAVHNRTSRILAYNKQRIYIVIVENNGIISNIQDDAMVIAAVMTANGPRPLSVGKIGTFYKVDGNN